MELYGLHTYMYVAIIIIWANLSKPHIMWLCWWHFCMYGGHSVLCSNSKLHDNFDRMQTIAPTHCTSSPCTIPCHIHCCIKLFQHGFWHQGYCWARGKTGRQSKLDNEEKRRELRDREMAQCSQNEIAGDSTCWQRDAVHRQLGQLKPESAYTVDFSCVWTWWEDAVVFINTLKSPCTLALHYQNEPKSLLSPHQHFCCRGMQLVAWVMQCFI